MAGAVRESWRGWGPTESNARYQTADGAGLKAADIGKLELKWAYGFSGDVTAFGALTMLNGTLFTGSAACTASTKGWRVTSATGTKSATGS